MRWAAVNVLFLFIALWISVVQAPGQCVTQTIVSPPDEKIFGLPFRGGGRLFIGAPSFYWEVNEVYVFERGAEGWVAVDIMTSMIGGESDLFGVSFAIIDDQLLIGNEAAQATPESSGAVEVFDADTLEPLSVVAPPGPGFYLFGRSIAAVGDILVVGAPATKAGDLFDVGAAFIYKRIGNKWYHTQTLPAPNQEQFDVFGYAVAIAGDLVLVGASGANDFDGVVYVYKKINGAWNLHQEIIPSNDLPSPVKWFGRTIAINADNTRAAIGATQAFGQNGAVYVYDFDGAQWQFTQVLLSSHPVGIAPNLGGSVDISADGKTIVAGAAADQEGVGSEGAAYIFRENAQGVFEEIKKILPPGPGLGGFGGVDLHGDTAFIAAASGNPGKVFVYQGMLGIDCNDNGTPDACDIVNGAALDLNNNGTPDECEPAACSGDINASGAVDSLDLNILLQNFGCNTGPGGPAPPCGSDLNADGITDSQDLNLLLAVFGLPCQ